MDGVGWVCISLIFMREEVRRGRSGRRGSRASRFWAVEEGRGGSGARALAEVVIPTASEYSLGHLHCRLYGKRRTTQEGMLLGYRS